MAHYLPIEDTANVSYIRAYKSFHHVSVQAHNLETEASPDGAPSWQLSRGTLQSCVIKGNRP